VLLTFVSPDCGPCIRLLPEIARWHDVMGDDITFAVVSNGGGSDRDAIVEQLQTVGDATAVIQDTQEVADQYRVLATPSALVVGPDGKVATGSAAGPVEIEALVRVALELASGTSDGPPRAIVESAA
jgi:thiol-disulfide isomerase/thioredoxin